MTTKLSDAKQLDWETARKAGERIVKICEGAGFTAPEDLAMHQQHIKHVCDAMNVLVKALLITPLVVQS